MHMQTENGLERKLRLSVILSQFCAEGTADEQARKRGKRTPSNITIGQMADRAAQAGFGFLTAREFGLRCGWLRFPQGMGHRCRFVGNGFRIGGKIDVVVRYDGADPRSLREAGVYVIEHKSSSEEIGAGSPY